MAKVFKNEAELKRFLLAKCKRALVLTEEKIYKIIDKFIKDYYKDYTPKMYDRTYQLFNSFVMTDVVPTKNGYEARVYFDLDGIKYVTGNMPTGEEVMAAAEQGLHGAIGDDFMYVSGNTGVDVWNTPSQIVDAKAIKMLEQELRKQGVPLTRR